MLFTGQLFCVISTNINSLGSVKFLKTLQMSIWAEDVLLKTCNGVFSMLPKLLTWLEKKNQSTWAEDVLLITIDS